MKTDTELLNEIAQKSDTLRQLSDEEAAKLKESLLDIHNYIISICDKYGIRIMLGGGSCLGAIRHKGYIPWDDDLDLMMPRDDYERLIGLYEKGVIDSKYHFEYPNPKKDVKNTFLKVFLKGTIFADVFTTEDMFPAGLFVDVFPIDYAPENNIRRRIKALFSDSLQFICTCTLYHQYPSKNLELFYGQDKDANKRYKLRRMVGRFFSVFPHRCWVYWFDKLNKYSKPSSYMTVPTGRKHYLPEALPASVFLPVEECTFEGRKSYIPNGYHEYLTNLYGDYMQVPPEDKRERHFIIDIKL